jgi:type IV secretory pathway protease TraF
MRPSHRVIAWFIGPTLVAALSMGLARAPAAPVVLFNGSDSVPKGFYRRVDAPVRPGVLIAFHVPMAARAYAARYLPARLRTSILKPAAAVRGASVCAVGPRLVIDGRTAAWISERDRRGVVLPRWQGCRRLGADEVFVLSTRIPNSFDSRYFGPVPASDVLGIYRPLWTL